MPSDHTSPAQETMRLRALPAQLVRIDDGVVVVRGCTEIRIVGERAEETVREVWSMAAAAPVTLEEIVAQYAQPDRASVEQLARKLVERRILVEAESPSGQVAAERGVESSLEIFYWHFGLTEREATSQLNERKLVIIGVNAVSRQLAAALAEANLENFEVVDYALVRNQRLFGLDTEVQLANWPGACRPPARYESWRELSDPGTIDCLIATSDHGATSALLEWNRFALGHGIGFLPIVLRRMVGYIGPFVVPGETACYECLCARENAHLHDHEVLRASEELAPYRQAVSGFFPSMGSILGDIAALELVKFYTGRMPYKVGNLIEVSLLAPSLNSRKVLRVPRCRACAPIMTRSSHSLERADFMPGSQFVAGEQRPEAILQAARERFAGKDDL